MAAAETKLSTDRMTYRAALGIGALALAAFAFVTTETMPIGLLPQIAGSLGASIPVTGWLVTAYAFTVAMSAVPLTALSAPLTRLQLLCMVIGVLLVTNVAAALSLSYAALLAARIVNAVAHGVFWSIVGSCAVRLVPERARALALAVVFGGVSLATVCGVPWATFVGQHFGWRVAFGAVAVTAMLILGIVALSIRDESTGAIHPQAVQTLLKNGAFRSVLMTTVLAVLGQFVAYTYIVPYVVRIDGYALEATAGLLMLFGLSGAIGNISAGAIANRSAAGASIFATAAITIGLLSLCWCGGNRVLAAASLAVWGFGAGGLAVGLQTRVLALAPDVPELASALFASSFNIGIGGGALIGGVIFNVYGLADTARFGAALAVLAVVVQAVSARSGFKRNRLEACAARN